jgi:hypothetical protein
MDVKLRYDLFNMLVRSTTSYVCEVWMESKKINVIEVVYRGSFKSLLSCEKQLVQRSCWQNLANSSSNTLHGDKRSCTLPV